MTRKLSMVVIFALAAVALLQNSASAATYIVGDSTGWDLPSSPSAYSDWAANKNFVVGDILVFNFMSSRHDVAEVTKTSYDNCNTANPISRQTSSPANVTLNATGEHHFICTFPGHCNSGQKLAINVTRAPPTPTPQPGDNSPSPSIAPVPTLTPTPTPTRPSIAPTMTPTGPSIAPTRPPTTVSTTPPTSSTPTTPPSTTTTTTPPPERNSATTFGIFAGLSLSGVALALFY